MKPNTISQTIVYYAIFILLGLTTAVIGPTLPDLAENTQASLGQVSYLFTAISLGYLVGALVGGRLYDRVGGHLLLLLALVVMIVCMAAFPLIPLLWVLVVAGVMLGLSQGVIDVGGNTLLVWVYQQRVGPFMNGLHFCFGVGAFLAPIIIAQALLLRGDISGGYWLVALLSLLLIPFLLRLPSPGLPAAQKEQTAAKQPIPWRLVISIAVFLFLYVAAEISYGGWVFTYAVESGIIVEETSAAYLTSAFWGALTLGRLLSIPLAVRLKPAATLLLDTLGCLVSVSVIFLWPGQPLALWVATIGLGLCMASVFPTAITLAGQQMALTGQINGYFFVGTSLGGMILPWAIGQLFEATGSQAMPVAILAALLLMGVGFTSLILQIRAARAAQDDKACALDVLETP
ncbi:MAG: MFS transporter [Anaerolineales bacterium]|nr:MFS transporter [Anaerolineales bacterium]